MYCVFQVPGWDAALLASAAATQDLSPGDILGYYLAIRHLPLLLLTGAGENTELMGTCVFEYFVVP